MNITSLKKDEFFDSSLFLSFYTGSSIVYQYYLWRFFSSRAKSSMR